MAEEVRAAQKEVADLKSALALAQASSLAGQAEAGQAGGSFLVAQLDGVDPKALQVSSYCPKNSL